MNFNLKDSQAFGRQLEVIELAIPLVIVGNATAASVLPTNDEPSLLFVKTDAVDQITPALDAGESLPTFPATSDASGITDIMLKVKEPVKKVISATFVPRTSSVTAVKPAVLAGTAGLDSAGDKICLSLTHGLALNAANTLDGTMIIKFIPVKSGF